MRYIYTIFIILQLFLVNAITAKEKNSFQTGVFFSLSEPYSYYGKEFKRYPSGGIFFKLPTKLENTNLAFFAEYGKITGKRKDIPDYNIISSKIDIEYTKFWWKRINIIPMFGISNTLVKIGGYKWSNIKKPFENTENEFGLNAGVSLGTTFFHDKLIVLIPVLNEIIFSQPEKFLRISGNICIGVKF